jgi:hypothetical protein
LPSPEIIRKGFLRDPCWPCGNGHPIGAQPLAMLLPQANTSAYISATVISER